MRARKACRRVRARWVGRSAAEPKSSLARRAEPALARRRGAPAATPVAVRPPRCVETSCPQLVETRDQPGLSRKDQIMLNNKIRKLEVEVGKDIEALNTKNREEVGSKKVRER